MPFALLVLSVVKHALCPDRPPVHPTGQLLDLVIRELRTTLRHLRKPAFVLNGPQESVALLMALLCHRR